MYKLNKLKILVILTFLYLINLIVTFKFTSITVGVNDDEFFEQLVSGFFTGYPEAYTHIAPASPQWFFGFITSRLYLLNNNFSWYYIFLAFLVVASLFCVNYVIWIDDFIQPIFKFSIFLINSYSLYWFISSPTYTSASFFMAFAGIFLYIYKLSRNSKSFKIEILSSIFLSISLSTRTESFLAAILLISPIVFALILVSKIKLSQKIMSSLVVFGPVLVIFFTNFAADMYYSTKTDWKIYQEFNKARYTIQDNELERFISFNLQKTSWSKERFKLFDSYNFVDFDSFNGNELNNLIKDVNYNELKVSININDLIKRWNTYTINFYYIFFGSIILIVYSIISQLSQRFKLKRRVISTIYLIIFICIWILIVIYITTFLRLPERIVFPILSTLIYGTILFEFKNSFLRSVPSETLSLKILQIGASILIFVGIVIDYHKMFSLRSNPAYFSFWSEQKISLREINKNKILIGNASQVKSIWSNPYTIDKELRELNFLPLGWYTFSPYWNKRAEKLGLASKSILLELNKNPNCYWLSDDEYTSYLINFNLEINGTELKTDKIFNKTFDFGDYSVYRFTY